ncbi:mechanosensitive ion channel family protein [Mucilaginibacter sp. KACC 22063]|uniref:mechanosensitive ion channel family protein n=1 Tax=Mucilaginibacter sp. KACC 22063 TaxID=3025666 RepID=UPI002366DE7D|nr:mechanosensitive ion channel family protein [Mucilaginibacter sp. KACC 22063]WDF55551.1 mechanosensitive ion channel family protein [Mucilaginibacter sp. KACC 22063]
MDIHLFLHHAYEWLSLKGPLFLLGAIVFIIGLWIIKLIRNGLKRRMSKREVHSSLQPFFMSLSITALYVLLIVLVLQIIDYPLTFFTTILGAATVAAGLALSGTLQNFAGGILILLLKPFELGDNIVAQGQDGVVASIQIFYTVVITFDNKTVIIPNGKLFNEVIVNVTREGKRRLDIGLKLGYVAAPEDVIRIIENSIKSTPDILPLPETVGVSALELDGIKYTIRVWVDPKNYTRIKLGLQALIVKDLREAGIKLPGT